MAKTCWTTRSQYIEDTYGYLSPEYIENEADELTACQRGECFSATCMLPAGHEGPHVFTPDDQIAVRFGPSPTQPERK